MSAPVLLNFLDNVPLPLTSVLVQLAPHISVARHIAEIVSWKAPWYNSWLVILLWWFICLVGEATLQYMIPLLLFLVVSIMEWTPPPRSSQPPVTELTLQTIVADLHVIQSLLPTLPSLPQKAHMARVLALLYVPYLIVTHVLRVRILVGIIGTLFLTHRSPWSIVTRGILWRSAHLRWTLYYTWSYVIGQPIVHNVSYPDAPSALPQPVSHLRFLFTIYENQRWWMGLDWTAALLPGERPSWCSASQQPVSPPNAFSLPRPTVVFVSDGKGRRVKRTAVWKWEEPEWRVIVHRTDGGISRVERPLSTGKEEGANRLLRGKRRDSSGQASTSASTSVSVGKEIVDSPDDNGEDVEDMGTNDPTTDSDGWVYGDNKWENQNNKGGIGKYTRYRRWTRIAVVHENVEIVQDDFASVEQTDPVNQVENMDMPTTDDGNTESRQQEGGALRQRLLNALNKHPASMHAQDD
ncbi:hypothetical protein AX17_005849 [Amanita inopinata Kibby_2008]|nr:hypothetical protein AX17_005849 [Amanita inopinata Kibby_2008]